MTRKINRGIISRIDGIKDKKSSKIIGYLVLPITTDKKITKDGEMKTKKLALEITN